MVVLNINASFVLMDSEEMEMDFTSSLEPVVIIDDSDDDHFYDTDEETKMLDLKTVIQNRIGPEVSLIPVRKSFKIKMFPKFHPEDSTILHKFNHRSPSPNGILISDDEFVKVENFSPNSKRISLPLSKCPICKKFFRRMSTHLQKHDIKKDPDDPLTCHFCMKSFNTSSNLSIHMRTHTGDKPYVCEVCTKGFAQSCNLVNHMRIHTGVKPFKCPHCDRAFTQSGNLSNHVRLHTDEKPFKCHFCDKAFTQSGNLSSHIRNNHKYVDNNIADE